MIRSFLPGHGKAAISMPHPRSDFIGRGLAAYDQENFQEAKYWFCQAVKANPGQPSGWVNLGNTLRRLLRPRAAAKCLTKALELAPASTAILVNLANAYRDMGRLKRAESLYRQALELDPRLAQAHFNLAMVLLAQGRMEEGWIHYQWRLGFLPPGRGYPRRHGLALWTGRDIKGRSVLVYDEQGLGDVLMFARYLKLLHARGAKVVLETRAELLALFRNQPYLEEVIDRRSNRPPATKCHLCSPLASLPLLLGTTMETIPAPIPYLAPDRRKSALWKRRLAAYAGHDRKVDGKALKIGLFWQNTTRIDSFRSVGLDNLSCLADLGRKAPLVFFGLQKELTAADRIHDWLVMLERHLTDLDQTAAIIDNLDLVVTIDTAVAHLAGAMGKPVWVLLSRNCDWRWYWERSDSPWYPGMRLFRQAKLGDWQPVIRQVTGALEGFIKRRQEKTGHIPTVPAAHGFHEQDRFEKAGELAAKGLTDQAASIYRHLASSESSLAPASCYNLGLIMLAKGNQRQAAKWFRRALEMQPGLAEAANNLGCALEALGRLEEAEGSFEKALETKPVFGEAAYNLGRVRLRMGRVRKAVKAFLSAVKASPGNHRAWNDLGVAYQQSGKLLEARKAFQRALSLEPGFIKAYQNLGNVWLDCNQPDLAIDCHAKATWLAGPTADGCLRQATLCLQWLRLEKARKYLEQALAIDPRHAASHTALGGLYLLQGDLTRGWQELQWRFRLPQSRLRIYPHRLSSPRWTGQVLKGRTILVHCEQGYGDTIQFIRYLPLVKQMGARVIAEVHPPLVNLFSTMEAADLILPLDPAKPCSIPVDFHVPLLDLPLIFNTRLETIPCRTPYLRPSHKAISRWQGRLDSGRPRVGVVWQGGDFHSRNNLRNLSLEQLAPLLELEGIDFISLQKFPQHQACRDDLGRYGLTDLGSSCRDFDDTAAVISQLDLLITVDTATAHLAGAMARPVWLLLPFLPDWRWMLFRSDSPWYPGMRLFRQLQPGNWDHPLAMVRDQLEILLQRRRLTA